MKFLYKMGYCIGNVGYCIAWVCQSVLESVECFLCCAEKYTIDAFKNIITGFGHGLDSSAIVSFGKALTFEILIIKSMEICLRLAFSLLFLGFIWFFARLLYLGRNTDINHMTFFQLMVGN